MLYEVITIEREDAGLEKEWPKFRGFDNDPEAVRAAIKNIARAGFEKNIHVELRNIRITSYNVCYTKLLRILDINMPDMDGFETLEHLNRLHLDIPVLFLTGAGSMDYAVKAINLGAYVITSYSIHYTKLYDLHPTISGST